MTDSPLHLGYLTPGSQERPSCAAEIREDFLGALSRVLDELSGLAETRCFEVLCMRRDGPDDTGGEVSRRGYVPTGTALFSRYAVEKKIYPCSNHMLFY